MVPGLCYFHPISFLFILFFNPNTHFQRICPFVVFKFYQHFIRNLYFYVTYLKIRNDITFSIITYKVWKPTMFRILGALKLYKCFLKLLMQHQHKEYVMSCYAISDSFYICTTFHHCYFQRLRRFPQHSNKVHRSVEWLMQT